MKESWYQQARKVRSKGSQAARPGSLAGLAAARREHQGQFFTPDAVVALMWSIIRPALDEAAVRHPDAKVSLIDTSVGSGRLFQHARPDRHVLAGCDVDADSIDALTHDAEEAGFEVDLVVAGLETIAPARHGIAILNPPFGLHIDAPTVRPLPGTNYGRFGPHSATVSHRYAIEQALLAADIVIAVLPRGASKAWVEDPGRHDRLRAVISLPKGSFREEGTEVPVELVLFGPAAAPLQPRLLACGGLSELSSNPFLLSCGTTAETHPKPMSTAAIASSAPVITEPVTGDATTVICHSGRRLHLKFRCGLTRARVMNGLLERPVERPHDKHRYPKGVSFKGQGRFDVEYLLLLDDPMRAFEEMMELIRAHGGEPKPAPGLLNYLRKRIARHKRESTPYRHVVRGAGAGVKQDATFLATAKHKRLLDPRKWGTALIREGEQHVFTRDAAGYRMSHPDTGEVLILDEPDFLQDFDAPAVTGSADDWIVVHEGRVHAFPELAKAIRAQIAAAGIDQWLDREYQVHDLIEMRMGRGGVVAWQMALGKTRCAIALALLGGKHNLIVLEPQLVEECIKEIQLIGLDDDLWQVIERPSDCLDLKKINIISYNRIRREVAKGAGRRTYARMLRRRIATVVADEGDVLTQHLSKQSQALYMLSPRRRYLEAGTPVRNMPRDILGVATYASGDGTALQPYGRHHPYAAVYAHKSMDEVTTGSIEFAEKHVVMQWVTHEFLDSGMVRGAKREIPKIRNLEALREYAAPILKRRTQEEPEVARYIDIPRPDIRTTTLEWDPAHLAHYLRVADEFAEIYRRMRKEADQRFSNINLVTLLARIGVVERACTCPQYPTPGFAAHAALTSKQRYLISRMDTLVKEGRKVICFVEQPMMADLLVANLARRGVEAIPFHGNIPMKKRLERFDARFRYGDAPVLVATKESGQAGYNIPQANYVLFGDRNWVARVENQALFRVLRGEQKNHVDAEFVHIEGSIDSYMDQVVGMKADTINACVDFLMPELQHLEFLHMDSILDSFVRDLAERRGFSCGHEFRTELKNAA